MMNRRRTARRKRTRKPPRPWPPAWPDLPPADVLTEGDAAIEACQRRQRGEWNRQLPLLSIEDSNAAPNRTTAGA